MKLRILSIIISVLCLLSCTEPNVYTSLGLYDPAEYSKGTIKTVVVENDKEFNLMSLTDDYRGKVIIKYTPKSTYNIIKQLSDKEADTLIQTIDYLGRYGDLDSYLSLPLDALSKTYCNDTKEFAVEILGSIKCFISTLSET